MWSAALEWGFVLCKNDIHVGPWVCGACRLGGHMLWRGVDREIWLSGQNARYLVRRTGSHIQNRKLAHRRPRGVGLALPGADGTPSRTYSTHKYTPTYGDPLWQGRGSYQPKMETRQARRASGLVSASRGPNTLIPRCRSCRGGVHL